VEASIGLARAFRMKVVGEGIDNPHTLAKLRDAGCDVGQGYLFAPPLRIARLARWMSERESQSAAGVSPMFEPARPGPAQAVR
jgi:EAL domain-containing protein (putative c-di-GMP-specific phosphodiesterase class I)